MGLHGGDVVSQLDYPALYEQAKRTIRQMVLDAGLLSLNDFAFLLVCHECGLPFRKDIEVGMVGEHARAAHGLDPDAGKLTLDLVWIGEGEPPKGKP